MMTVMITLIVASSALPLLPVFNKKTENDDHNDDDQDDDDAHEGTVIINKDDDCDDNYHRSISAFPTLPQKR